MMAQSSLTPFEPPPHVPEELRKRRQWIAWRAEWDPARGKYDKIPVCVPTGRAADYLKPEMHVGYEEAIAAVVANPKLSGIGFVLTPGCGVVGGDLDDCRKPDGEVETWAGDIMDLAETYFEVSPSEKGVRFFALGELKRAIKFTPAHVELYASGRFLTFTGRHIVGTPLEVNPAPRVVTALARRVREFRDNSGQTKASEGPVDAEAVEDFRQFLSRDRSPFGRVNQAAMQRLGDWVPLLFPTARHQPGTGAWRVWSHEWPLNRPDLEEELSIAPNGIVWYGVADMGDARQGKRSPIDLVMAFHPIVDGAVAAAQWLADELGVEFTIGRQGDAGEAPLPDPDADLPAQFEAALEALRKHSPRPQFVTAGMDDAQHGRLRFDADYGGPLPVRAGITDRLTRGAVAMVSAGANVGKSTYLSLEALAIATENGALLGQPGIDWCGHCLIVSNEESAVSAQARWRALMTLNQLTRADLKHNLDVWSPAPGKLRLAKLDQAGAVVPTQQAVEFVHALAAMAEAREPVAFLGLDPLISLMDGVGENTEQMDKVIGILTAIADAGFLAIDAAHHQGKSKDTESVLSFRGSSAIFAAVAEMSTLVTLTAEEGKKYGFEPGQHKRTLRLMGQRQRDAPIPGVFYYERLEMPLIAEDPRQPGVMKLRNTATLKPIAAPTKAEGPDELTLWATLWRAQTPKRQIRRGGLQGNRHPDQAWVIMQELNQWTRARSEGAILRLIEIGGARVEAAHDDRGRDVLFLDVMRPPPEPEEEEHPF